MDANALLSTIILVAFIVTVVLAVGSYAAYKVREHRRPRAKVASAGSEPMFFERIYPRRAGATARDADESRDVSAS